MLLNYIIRRTLWSIPFMFAASIVAFALITLPPGDYVTTFAQTLSQSGDVVDSVRLDALRERYGLDQPFIIQYFRWIGGVQLVGVPQQLVPLHHDARWGIPWSQWYNSGGKDGEEPPETIKARMALYDQSKSTADPEERARLLKEIAQAAADEFEVMGVAKAAVTYGIVKNNLANVPETMVNSWFWPTPAPVLPQTWFYKQ